MNFNQSYYFLFFLFFTFHLPILSKPIPRKTLSLGSNERKIIPISLQSIPPSAFALVSIGDPPVQERLHIDTGADITWVLHDKVSGYDPLKSSSFSFESCDGLSNSPFISPNNKTGHCNYAFRLADKTVYLGILGNEVFTFQTGDRGLGTLKNILFGFGITRGGRQAGTGTLGLKLGNLSIVKSLGGQFSICIGNFYDNFNGKHFLALGDDAVFGGMEISLDTTEETYKINLASIIINGDSLGIQEVLSKSSSVLDTGTSSISLVKEVYDAVSQKIVTIMRKAGYKEYPIGTLICYAGMLPNHIPLRVRLKFDKIILDMKATTLFMQIDDDNFCLNVDQSPAKQNLIGMPVFQGRNVGFDIQNDKLYIKDIECNKLYDSYKDELGHRDP